MRSLKLSSSLFRYLILCLLFSCLLVSCSENHDESVAYSFYESGGIEYSEHLTEDEQVSDISGESPELPTPHETLSSIIEDMGKKDNFTYEISATLTAGKEISHFTESYIKQGEDVHSRGTISIDDITIWTKDCFYIDGVAYIDDDMLGLCRFSCEQEHFSEYIKLNISYYELLSSSFNVTQAEEGIFQYEFSSQILNESFVKMPADALGFLNVELTKGECTLYKENDIIAKADGTIFGEGILGGKSCGMKVDFEILFSEQAQIVPPDENEYVNFETSQGFAFSKAFYNLAYSDAYEVSETVRLYTNYADKKFYDISSETIANFLMSTHTLNFKATCTNEKTAIVEHIIEGDTLYTTSYFDGENASETFSNELEVFLTKELALPYASIYPFSFIQMESYEILENDNFYIIDLTYKNDAAKAIFTVYYNNYKGLFPHIDDIRPENEYVFVAEGKGSITVRKSDMKLVEQTLNVTLSTNDGGSVSLVSTWEVIALNEDVHIVQ